MSLFQTEIHGLQNNVVDPKFAHQAVLALLKFIEQSGGDNVEVVAAAVFDRKGYDTVDTVIPEERNLYSHGQCDDIYLHVAIRAADWARKDTGIDALMDEIASDERVKLAESRDKAAKRADLLSQRAALDAKLAELEE